MSDFPRQFDVIRGEPDDGDQELIGEGSSGGPLSEGFGAFLILLGVAIVLAVCCGGAYKILELVIPHA